MGKIATTLFLGLAVLASTGRATPLDDDPFAFDAAFHGGVPITDRFGGSEADARDQYGRKLLQLSNGSVVVAALVPAVGETQNQANGSYNLGLTRYSAAGERMVWSSPTPGYTDSTRQYLVFPNNAQAGYRGIGDIKEHDGRIYVTLKHRVSSSLTLVHLVSFGLDGSFTRDGANVFWILNPESGTDDADSGASLVFYRDSDAGVDRMIVAYALYDSGTPSVRLRRSTLLSTSPFMQIDFTFGANGIVDLPVKSCTNPSNTPVDCAATVRDVVASYGTRGSSTSGAKPKIYIGGDYQRFLLSDKGWDLMVMKVDVDGVLQNGFGNAGIARIPFDVSSGATQNDRARGIALGTHVFNSGGIPVVRDEIYVAAAVDMKCHAGIGIATLDYAGQLRTDFGDGGKRVFGGANGTFCPVGAKDTPRALAYDDGRLAIAGNSTHCPSGACLYGSGDDPMLAIVRTRDGALTEWRDHPVRETGDARIGGGAFEAVIPAVGGRFYAAGNVRDAGNDHRTLLQTVRLRSDRIFGDGLE